MRGAAAPFISAAATPCNVTPGWERGCWLIYCLPGPCLRQSAQLLPANLRGITHQPLSVSHEPPLILHQSASVSVQLPSALSSDAATKAFHFTPLSRNAVATLPPRRNKSRCRRGSGLSSGRRPGPFTPTPWRKISPPAPGNCAGSGLCTMSLQLQRLSAWHAHGTGQSNRFALQRQAASPGRGRPSAHHFSTSRILLTISLPRQCCLVIHAFGWGTPQSCFGCNATTVTSLARSPAPTKSPSRHCSLQAPGVIHHHSKRWEFPPTHSCHTSNATCVYPHTYCNPCFSGMLCSHAHELSAP